MGRVGSEAQMDWHEAGVGARGRAGEAAGFRDALDGRLGGVSSGLTEQAFLEAHQLAFAYFGGVFRPLRYNNLKSAVKKLLRGYRREKTSHFIAFCSHWRLQSEFCNPASGNEKVGVEGEGGYFRRKHWVPLPEARDLDELNRYLERCCGEDHSRVLAGRSEAVGAAMLIEQPQLLPLVAMCRWPKWARSSYSRSSPSGPRRPPSS